MTARQESGDDGAKRFKDFTLKDYELKIAYLTNHYQRMWTRFNYFVVIEAALIGGKTIFGGDEIKILGLWLGLGLSILWYMMGAEDRYLVVFYRSQVKEAGVRAAQAIWPESLPAYRSVGDLSNIENVFPKIHWSLTCWRVEAISTTRLAALIPFAVSLMWLGLLLQRLWW